MSDPKVEEIRTRLETGPFAEPTRGEVEFLLTKLDEAEKANAWDGEWRTIPQTEDEARRVLTGWTKAMLVNFHIGAWQRELQRGEFWRSQLTARAESAEERERVLIAGVREALLYCDPHGEWTAPIYAILSRLLPSTPKEADRG